MSKSLTEQIKELMPEEKIISVHDSEDFVGDKETYNIAIQKCKSKIPEILSLIRGEVEKKTNEAIDKCETVDEVDRVKDFSLDLLEKLKLGRCSGVLRGSKRS